MKSFVTLLAALCVSGCLIVEDFGNKWEEATPDACLNRIADSLYYQTFQPLFSPTSIPSFSSEIAATTAVGGAATNTNSMINAGVNTAESGSQIVAPVFMGSTQSNDNDIYQLAAQLGIQSSI